MSFLDPFAMVPPAQECAGCGCTDDQACPGGCSWVAPRWCSSCNAQITAATTSMKRVNPTEAVAEHGTSDGKGDTKGRPLLAAGRHPARTTVDAPATPRAGASTTPDRRPRWHEIVYRDPRKGPRRPRMVKLPDAREEARRVARRIGATVEIWAVFADDTSELVEVLP